MVFVPAGDFQMGSISGDADEKPVHTVTLSKPFYLGKYEVTNEQFRRFRPDHASEAHDGLSLDADQQPVAFVSWMDAGEFCDWSGLRLPTEAQWEYACRAGSTGRYWWGDRQSDAGRRANVADQTAKKRWTTWTIFYTDDGHTVSAEVGSFEPNAWGLYDMLGNVWEWCADWYDEKYYLRTPKSDPRGGSSGAMRVFRGGAWDGRPDACRCANRSWGKPSFAGVNGGFRVAFGL